MKKCHQFATPKWPKFRQLYGALSVGACVFLLATMFINNGKNIQRNVTRMPASVFSENDFEYAPSSKIIWLQKVWVADKAGVMERMKGHFDYWDHQEELARNWNLESSGLYDIRDAKERRSYFSNNVIKYLDKRISGEIKTAQIGSALYTVGKVQEALRPNTEIGLSSDYKIKFKARALAGTATMMLVNPYCEAKVEAKLNGEVHLIAKKKFERIDTEATIDLMGHSGRWLASLDHKLTEHIKARASTEIKLDFSRETDSRLEFFFNTSF